MISIADTTVSRKQNLYRFQVDSYPKYDILRLYENNGRKGKENTVKTIYDGEGFAYLANLETGEVIREKKASEIRHSVDTSIARTRKVMREILSANTWNYFVTLTFNSSEQDRMSDKEVYKQWTKFRRDIRVRYPDMRYLAVPERHKSGAIHFHLVVGNISETELKLVYSGHNDKKRREIYNCYVWKYGFSTVTKVDDTEKVSSYILKYIGKSLGVSDDFKKRYWASKNCNRPKKRFVDILTSAKVKVFDLFDSIVDRTVTMTVQFWSGIKNYIAVKDSETHLRKTDLWFKNRRSNLECHYKNAIGGRSYFWKVVQPKAVPCPAFD